MRLSANLVGFSLLALGAVDALAGGVGRFSIKSTADIQATTSSRELTAAEIYAKALTRRKPTPRSTAQRRQVSETPPIDNNVPLGIFTADLQLGYLGLDADTGAITLTDDVADSQWTYTASPSWLVGSEKRITSSSPTHPVLGFSVCDGNDAVMSVVSTSYVCLAGVATATPGGSTPVSGLSTTLGTSSGVLTDVWTFNYVLGTITPVWVNPSGASVALTLMVNQLTGKVVATGNPVLFPVTYGTSWVPFTFQYLLV